MKIDKLSLLIYTCEQYLPISKLSMEEFNRYTTDLEIKKYLVSNKITDNFFTDNLGFELLDSNVKFSENSTHFADNLIYALEKIEEKYVLLWVEDTIIGTDMKSQNLKSVIDLLDENEIDHLSLLSYGHDWEILDVNYSKYNLPDSLLFKMPNSYLYTFSLQPAIWNTKKLLEVLKHNQGITLHQFDTSEIKNKKGILRSGDDGYGYINTPDDFWDYGIKHTCFRRTFETTPYCFDDRPFDGDYFLFLYSGIVRGGKFDFNTHHNSREFVIKFLNEKNITKEDETYTKFF